MFKFKQLVVWQKAFVLVRKYLDIADKLPKNYQYSFGEQLRRAALSILNNISEGCGRSTDNQASVFYDISHGSVCESLNIILVIYDRKLVELNANEIILLENESEEICKMLGGLIRYKNHTSN